MKGHKSRIDRLIEELCPNGVLFSKISDLCYINRGKVISKEYLVQNAGEYPVYSSQTEDSGVFGKIKTYDYDGEFVTWTTDGANAGSVFYRKGRFSITNVCGLLKPRIKNFNIKYLNYILGFVAKQYVNSGMGNPKLMSNNMSQIEIPVPPREVQEEIVRILDKFTQLESELESELESRKKQYKNYRAYLLSFKDGIDITELGKIAIVEVGNKPGTITEHKTDYEYINSGTIKSGYTNEYNCEGGTVTTPSRGQGGIGFVGYQNKRFWLGSLCYKIQSKDDNIIANRYLYYFLNNNSIDINKLKKEGSIPAINRSDLIKLKITIPSITDQQRIIKILDKFEALVNDISVGLPAELAARRKQYEYYRNKLLTFKKLPTANEGE